VLPATGTGTERTTSTPVIAVAGFGMDLVPPNGFFFSIAALLALYLGLVCWRSRVQGSDK
jgi:hypothetical protein